jgi:hypothetical protein
MEERLKKTIDLFVVFVRKTHGVELYHFQREIASIIIRAALSGTGGDYFAQVSRQAGKTHTIVFALEFLMIFAPKILNRPFRVGIFAPQKEQTKTDFDRLKEALTESWREGFSTVVDAKESNAVTLQLSNGSYCYTFPLTETSHPESKTLDLVIYEEANKIKDKEKKDKADPMKSATNAPSLSVGVGGYHSNYFKRGIDKGENVVKADYREVIKQKKEAFEKDKNEFHLNYGRFIERVIKENGLDDESFKTQFGLEFIVGGGSFISPDQLHALRGNFEAYFSSKNECVAGLDTAKYPDRTVLTVKDLKEKRIACWLRLQGDNYEDQFEIIKKRLQGFPNLLSLAIDSTGQGDFMPDLFENRSDIDIMRVKFSMQSKDAMSKNLLAQIRNKATTYPKNDGRERQEFEHEMLELEREYKGEYLSVHHPDDPKAHDDYFASWMLAEWAHHEFLENQPDIHVVTSGGKGDRKKSPDEFHDDDDDE